ncbi:MAG: deoxyribose-phosphate aldolase [Elusimicrobiota bacterium]|jgi:deoxyribose-phosphate aldolase|nr:deoxyribose-phosphate aldolase [Elusimicrobiota bacterium]
MDISKYIDFTLLKPNAKVEDYKTLCLEAKKNNFYSVCVPPFMVKECKSKLKDSDVKITTVIGFPLGYVTIETKADETIDAIKNGADDIDMVINISELKSGNIDYVKTELKEMRIASKGKTLKVIIETCYLSKDEIALVSKLISESGADFVKTSTGFGTGGATLEDIEIIKKSIDPKTKIKAAGGIRTYEAALSFIKAGVSRIGASSLLTP